MTTGVACPVPILQYFNNSGQFNVGGSILTQIGGVNAATYQDVGLATPLPNPIPLNSRGEVSNAAGASCQLFLPPNTVYTFTIYDVNGNQLDVATYVGGFQYVLTAPEVAAVMGFFGQSPQEINATVTPLNYGYPPGYPERYINPGFTYALAATGVGGTDFSGAIQQALNIPGQPCILGPYNYTCNVSLTMPNEQKLIGQGLNETGICYPPATFTGDMLNWNTVAASKIEIRGITFYGNTAAGATGGLIIGSGAAPYGTEGYIDQVMVRDLPANAKAYDINCNVGEFGNIYALNTAGIRLLGSGISVVAMENTNASGFEDVNGNISATEIQDGWVGLFECEAPQTGLILLTVAGQLVVDYFVPSLAASTTFAHLIYLTSSANSWSINVPQIYYGGSSGTFPTFTNLFYDQGAANFFGAGNLVDTTAAKGMCGPYSSGLTTQGTQFAIKKQQLNNFSIQLTNNSGTIQHKISAAGQTGVSGTWITSISGDSISYTTTPTGTDATTAFAAGAKISSTDNYLLVLNSGAEVASDAIMFASITLNTTTAAWLVRPTIINLNINGTTQNWLAFWLTNATSGANESWATALGTSNYSLEVTFLGFVQ